MNTKTEEILKELNENYRGKRSGAGKDIDGNLSRGHICWMTFPEWERPRWHLHALKY